MASYYYKAAMIGQEATMLGKILRILFSDLLSSNLPSNSWVKGYFNRKQYWNQW